MVKTIAILIDIFFFFQGKMSQEDDCSSDVEIEGAEVWVVNEESWGIRARPRSKKRSSHPFTRGFVPMGHPPPRAG